LSFPLPINQVKLFEKNNPHISVNIYILELHDGQFIVVPCHVTKAEQSNHVNLLLIQEEDTYVDEVTGKRKRTDLDAPIRFHYVLIKSLSRLIRSQITQNHSTIHFCSRCLHYFYTPEALKRHLRDCGLEKPCRVRLPTEDDNILSFKNHKHDERVPFVVYADLECLLKSVNREITTTREVQEHEPFAVGFYTHCSYKETLSGYQAYRGPDLAAWFARQLYSLAKQVESLYDNPVKMVPLTPQQETELQQALLCHICHQPFYGKNGCATTATSLEFTEGLLIPFVTFSIKTRASFLSSFTISLGMMLTLW